MFIPATQTGSAGFQKTKKQKKTFSEVQAGSFSSPLTSRTNQRDDLDGAVVVLQVERQGRRRLGRLGFGVDEYHLLIGRHHGAALGHVDGGQDVVACGRLVGRDEMRVDRCERDEDADARQLRGGMRRKRREENVFQYQ